MYVHGGGEGRSRPTNAVDEGLPRADSVAYQLDQLDQLDPRAEQADTFLDHQRTSPHKQSASGNRNRAVVSVCKNKHCCRRGANALYMRLKDEAMVRRDVDIDVRTSSCLKHCKRGPAAHVSVFLDGEEDVREVICVNVGGEHNVADLAEAYTMLLGAD